MRSLFIDCNDHLAPVWRRVSRADDPPIDINRAAFQPTELPRLLNGYAVCLDDHSYLPTALVEQCDQLKHIIFLGTGAASYMNVRDLAQRGIRVHTIGGYGDTAVAEHTIALMLACCRGIARMEHGRPAKACRYLARPSASLDWAVPAARYDASVVDWGCT